MSEFLRQTNQPLFPKVFWEKPVNKKAAKKLLIIGGHASEFSATQMAYEEALAAGIGEAKVVLPDSVLKLTGQRPDCLFVPSTKSGSLAKSAQAEVESYIKEADGVLLAGEFSENSETTSLLEAIVRGCTVPLVITQHVISLLAPLPGVINTQGNRLLIANMQTYAKLAGELKLPIKIQAGQNLVNKIDILKSIHQTMPIDIVLSGAEALAVSGGKASVTPTATLNAFGDGTVATFWLQYQNKFEALTSAVFVLSQAKSIMEINRVVSKLSE